MRRVFADTFYFIALMNPSDPAHQRAVAFSKSEGAAMVTTTESVLTELGNAVARSDARRSFRGFVHRLKADPLCTVVPSTDNLFGSGIDLYHARPDKTWSLTDCMSFVVMKDHGLVHALTGDHHFEQAGFKALLLAK